MLCLSREVVFLKDAYSDALVDWEMEWFFLAVKRMEGLRNLVLDGFFASLLRGDGDACCPSVVPSS